MRIEQIEIYSDASNAAIMRHPGRRFPGLLLQGDTLHSLAAWIERAVTRAEQGQPLDDEACEGLFYVEDLLRGMCVHYAETMTAHGLALPHRKIDPPRSHYPDDEDERPLDQSGP